MTRYVLVVLFVFALIFSGCESESPAPPLVDENNNPPVITDHYDTNAPLLIVESDGTSG